MKNTFFLIFITKILTATSNLYYAPNSPTRFINSHRAYYGHGYAEGDRFGFGPYGTGF